MKLKKLIVNADDFGLTEGNTIAHILCHEDGILTSTTLMVNMPFAPLAVALAKKHPKLGVGLHLTLTMGRPVLEGAKSFTDENGNFRKKGTYENGLPVVDEEELYAEWKAQMEKFIKMMGKKPTHIDSHHHVHLQDNLLPIAKRLAKEYDLPMRLRPQTDKTNYDYEVALMLPGFYDDTAKPSYFTENTFGIWDEEIIEVMCHPAFIDQRLIDISSYCTERANELQTIRDPEVKKWVKESGVELITFADLKKVKKEEVVAEKEETILDEIKEKAEDIIEDIKEEVNEVIEDIKEEVEEIKEEITGKKSEEKEIEDILEEIIEED